SRGLENHPSHAGAKIEKDVVRRDLRLAEDPSEGEPIGGNVIDPFVTGHIKFVEIPSTTCLSPVTPFEEQLANIVPDGRQKIAHLEPPILVRAAHRTLQTA